MNLCRSSRMIRLPGASHVGAVHNLIDFIPQQSTEAEGKPPVLVSLKPADYCHCRDTYEKIHMY